VYAMLRLPGALVCCVGIACGPSQWALHGSTHFTPSKCAHARDFVFSCLDGAPEKGAPNTSHHHTLVLLAHGARVPPGPHRTIVRRTPNQHPYHICTASGRGAVLTWRGGQPTASITTHPPPARCARCCAETTRQSSVHTNMMWFDSHRCDDGGGVDSHVERSHKLWRCCEGAAWTARSSTCTPGACVGSCRATAAWHELTYRPLVYCMMVCMIASCSAFPSPCHRCLAESQDTAFPSQHLHLLPRLLPCFYASV
jgi:hypothetical protein